MKAILLTRPKVEALKTRRLLTKIGFKVFIESMFLIKYTPFTINSKKFDIIISTSKNSIIALRRVVKKCHCRIIVVGDSTMQAAKKLGFSDVVSLSGTVDDIVAYVRDNYSSNIRILYVRGEKITLDLKTIMNNYNFLNVKDVILYNTIVRKKFSRQCYQLLKNDCNLSILLYSTVTAEIFIQLVKYHGMIEQLNNMTAYVISNKVANRIKNIAFKDIVIAAYPNQESLLSLLKD